MRRVLENVDAHLGEAGTEDVVAVAVVGRRLVVDGVLRGEDLPSERVLLQATFSPTALYA